MYICVYMRCVSGVVSVTHRMRQTWGRGGRAGEELMREGEQWCRAEFD